jgi:hypothetical protein
MLWYERSANGKLLGGTSLQAAGPGNGFADRVREE